MRVFVFDRNDGVVGDREVDHGSYLLVVKFSVLAVVIDGVFECLHAKSRVNR